MTTCYQQAGARVEWHSSLIWPSLHAYAAAAAYAHSIHHACGAHPAGPQSTAKDTHTGRLSTADVVHQNAHWVHECLSALIDQRHSNQLMDSCLNPAALYAGDGRLPGSSADGAVAELSLYGSAGQMASKHDSSQHSPAQICLKGFMQQNTLFACSGSTA